MRSNMDAAISTLAVEIAELDKQGKGVQVQMGHKLIALRELLRERNGVSFNGCVDATGHRAPRGWEKWVRQNLPISVSHAGRCIQTAVDPDRLRKHRENVKKYSNRRPGRACTYIKSCWPNLSTEDRSKIRQLVIELSREAY